MITQRLPDAPPTRAGGCNEFLLASVRHEGEPAQGLCHQRLPALLPGRCSFAPLALGAMARPLLLSEGSSATDGVTRVSCPIWAAYGV